MSQFFCRGAELHVCPVADNLDPAAGGSGPRGIVAVVAENDGEHLIHHGRVYGANDIRDHVQPRARVDLAQPHAAACVGEHIEPKQLKRPAAMAGRRQRAGNCAREGEDARPQRPPPHLPPAAALQMVVQLLVAPLPRGAESGISALEVLADLPVGHVRELGQVVGGVPAKVLQK